MKKRYVVGMAILVIALLIGLLLLRYQFKANTKHVDDEVEIIRYSLTKERILTLNGEKFTFIRPGDTLSEIAQQVGIPQEELMRFNGITDPDNIMPNDILRLSSPEKGKAAILPKITDFPEIIVRKEIY